MSRRTLIIVGVVVGVAAVVAAAYLLLGGPGGAGSQSELDLNAAKWKAERISHYEADVSVLCFCPWGGMMPVTVEVQDGEIISLVENAGQPVPPSDPLWTVDESDLLTVDGLFDYLRRAQDEADKVDVTYDPSLGYPAQINVDWIELAMDDEMAITVHEVRALP